MKLARFIISGKAAVANLKGLLSCQEPDFLQLDCPLDPTQQIPPSLDGNSMAPGARTLISCMTTLHQALFLRPEVRVVTNAGGNDVLGCMQSLGEFLVQHGSSDLPIAAIRGGNLLPAIEEYLSVDSGIDPKELVSAQVEIGGGPLATALAEGARIVVVSAYDVAAPYLAASVSSGLCAWHDGPMLGNLAAASQFVGVSVEVFDDGRVELEQTASTQLPYLHDLSSVQHADVVCEYANAELKPTPRNTTSISQVVAKANSKTWNLILTTSEGFQATLLLECSDEQFSLIEEFCQQNSVQGIINMSKFLAADPVSREAKLLIRLEYQAITQEQCHKFVESLQFYIKENHWGQIVAPLPSIQLLSQSRLVPIAADQVVLSVDTRPAREWL